MLSGPEAGVVQTERASLASTIGKLSAILASESFPSSERAAIKRLAVNEPLPLAFYRFWVARVAREFPPDRQAQDWAVILSGLALTRGKHDPKSSYGAALASARYSEARFERLLSAPDAGVRRILFARAVRFLAAKGVPFDWIAPAAWLLASDDHRDAAARRIARDYFHALSRTQPKHGD